jgi:LysR family transcriptional regulator, glycine cleavage system transcriptional activator
MIRRKSLPLNSLRAFEAAARLGRITAAADELAVTHGAVSRQVSQLEAFLGVDLFEGPRSRPVLTPSGARLLLSLTPALDQIDAVVRTIADDAGGVLDVACLSTFAMRWLIPRLHRFQKWHPAIDVRLSTVAGGIPASRGRCDLEILAIDGTEKLAVGDVLLFVERLGVVVAPSLLAVKKTVQIKDLAGIPRLATRTRMNAWPMWLALVGAGPTPRHSKPAAVFEHYYFTIEAALNGLGVCVAPLHLVSSDVISGRLLAPLGFIESGYRYIVRHRRPENKKAARFCAWLKHEAVEAEKSLAHAIMTGSKSIES